MAEITVCLLNWKRPENLPLVLEGIASQSVETRVFLWDNGQKPIEDPRIDWRIRSSANMACWPRWFMAVHADTPWVCSLDDDLRFGDPHVLRDGILAAEGLEADQLVGPFGRNLSPGLSYSEGSNVWGPEDGEEEDWNVDIIKGRHIVARTETLKDRLPLFCSTPTEDDIAVCGLVAEGRRHHHVRPHTYLHRLQRFQELPAPHAIWERPGHLSRRDEVARRYFQASD
ncbi:MAG: hypothetical protein HKO65_06270 [Gemmatimonadetes bacterium]|nr:hypothetical protein [Gemmatimonadota bacterium]NNM04692.1 hypothetical protein [Gemmatimonadota bacterium]